ILEVITRRRFTNIDNQSRILIRLKTCIDILSSMRFDILKLSIAIRQADIRTGSKSRVTLDTAFILTHDVLSNSGGRFDIKLIDVLDNITHEVIHPISIRPTRANLAFKG